MELQKDRPQTNEGRLKKEISAYDLMDSAGVEYLRSVSLQPPENRFLSADDTGNKVI